MNLWLDDVRPAPEGYEWAQDAHAAIWLLELAVKMEERLEMVSLDHDLGADPLDGIYARGNSEDCGCLVVDWIVQNTPSIRYPIRIHSWNGEEARKMAANLNDAGYDVEIRPYEPLRFSTP